MIDTTRTPQTQMDKVIDFLLGNIAERWKDKPEGCDKFLAMLLESTAHRPHLPNRKRLVELVEAAMPKDEAAP